MNISDSSMQSPGQKPPFTNFQVDVQGQLTFKIGVDQVGTTKLSELKMPLLLKAYTLDGFGQALKDALTQRKRTAK